LDADEPSEASITIPAVLVPVLVFLACVSAGAVTAARRLPDLGEGTIGGLAFLIVCCLLGAALGIVGLRIYGIAHALGDSSGLFKADIVASGLSDISLGGGLCARDRRGRVPAGASARA
jgi:hypothetical protein